MHVDQLLVVAVGQHNSPEGCDVADARSSAGTFDVGYVAPFWAVILTDRDNQQLVNMRPYQDEYTMIAPVAKCYNMNFMAGMKIHLTFLTNMRDIQAGELLVLPFDGGCPEVFPVPPSQSAGSSGYEPSD